MRTRPVVAETVTYYELLVSQVLPIRGWDVRRDGEDGGGWVSAHIAGQAVRSVGQRNSHNASIKSEGSH